MSKINVPCAACTPRGEAQKAYVVTHLTMESNSVLLSLAVTALPTMCGYLKGDDLCPSDGTCVF